MTISGKIFFSMTDECKIMEREVFCSVQWKEKDILIDSVLHDKVDGSSDCEFPYKSRVMGTSEPLKPLKAPYMARNPVKWGFFRLKGQEIPLKI